MKKSADRAVVTSVDKLEQIQEQKRDMCEPHYDEYYKVTTERGFVKITLPKRKR